MAGKLKAIEVYDLMVDAAWGEKIPIESGQYRTCLDKTGPKMVKVLNVIGSAPYETGPCDWRVQDMGTGKIAAVRAPNLSNRVYNELEVLAWMAK